MLKRSKMFRCFLVCLGFLSCSPNTWNPEIDAVMRYRKQPHKRSSIARLGVERGPKSTVKLKDRTASLESQKAKPSIQLRDNLHVRKYVNLYTGKKKKDLVVPLERYVEHKPLVEKVLGYYNLPQELAYVALVESKFDNEAKSEDGAVGLWQFMKPTAENLGLSCSFWKDERKDVLRSTIAAAKYLNELHSKFGDWLLALAAYNLGPNKLANAIEKANGERDFYKLASQNLLPKETIDHVSKFIAIAMITKNPDLYQMASGGDGILGDQPLVD